MEGSFQFELVLLVFVFIVACIGSTFAIIQLVCVAPNSFDDRGGRKAVSFLFVVLVFWPGYAYLLTNYTFTAKRLHRIQVRHRESPEFSVDKVVIKNIDVTSGNNLAPTFSFTLHANNRYKSRDIYYAAAEAKLSFHYCIDGYGRASLVCTSRWYHDLDSETLAFATMTAAPVNLPPGNNVPTGGIAFSAEPTNVTVTDDQASLLIEYKQNLDKFDAFLTVRALVKNGITDARSRLLEVNCGSMSLAPNFTQVFMCRRVAQSVEG